jgi:hypothetical protein
MDMSDAIALSQLDFNNQDWINEFVYLPPDQHDSGMNGLQHCSLSTYTPSLSSTPLSSPTTTMASPVLDEQVIPGMGLNMFPMYYPVAQPYLIAVPQPQQDLAPPSPVSVHGEVHEEKKLSASEKKKLRELARNLTCHNCGTQRTPLWRRTMDKKHSLCNACSLYERQHKRPRPISYKDRNPRAPKRSAKEGSITLEQVLSTVANARQNAPPEGSVTLEWGMLQQLLTAVKKD